MRIKVNFFGPIRRPWKQSHKEIEMQEGTTIGQLLNSFGYSQEEAKRIAIVVNGKKASREQQLVQDDDIRLVLMAGGG